MKLFAPFVLIVAGLAAAFWWDDTAPSADLVVANDADVFTLDPQRMSWLQDFRVCYALYEGLVRWNNQDMSVQPAAADLPAISDDRLTYTFHIRPDAKWSNGDPVTAHDFVYAGKRLIFPDTASDYTNLFFIIEGAQDFLRWRNQQVAEFAKRSDNDRRELAEQLFDEADRQFESMVAIRALDDRTLQIKLQRPTAYFLDLLCLGVFYPVHRPCVEGWPESGPASDDRGWIARTPPPWNQRRFVKVDPTTGRLEQRHEWARPGIIVTNGPYLLTQWRYKRDMRLERNPLYHDQGMIKSNSVSLVSISDPSTAVLAYESGKIDWLIDVSADYQADMLQQRQRYIDHHRAEIDSLMAQGRTFDEALGDCPKPERGERRNIHPMPAFATDFFSFNCRPKLSDGRDNPFADASVRRAFTLATDKEAIVKTATRLNEPLANTIVPRGSVPGYHSPDGLPYDPARGRQEMAKAGWIDRNHDGVLRNAQGEPFPPVDLLYTTNSQRYKWVSLELKSQWERELGVTIELRGQDSKFFREHLKSGKYMIARGNWYGDYTDPTTFLDFSITGNGNNDRGFSNAQFDSMMTDAQRETDPQKRLRTLEDAERFLCEDQIPVLPICQKTELYMYEPGKLKGLSHQARLVQYLWQLERIKGD